MRKLVNTHKPFPHIRPNKKIKRFKTKDHKLINEHAGKQNFCPYYSIFTRNVNTEDKPQAHVNLNLFQQ